MRDRERSQRFYETYFGFDAGSRHAASRSRWRDGGEIRLPGFPHFGAGLASPEAVLPHNRQVTLCYKDAETVLPLTSEGK